MTPDLEQKVSKIENRTKEHHDLGIQILRADGGNFFDLDFLAAAAIKRSLAHSKAFGYLVREENYICAASIVRLQLDSCLRFFAAFLVENPHDFAREVLRGKSIRKMKDRTGEKMTDRYLVETLGKEHNWMPRVYERTSGFIHLSNKHIFSTIDLLDEAGKAEIVIGPGDPNIPPEFWVEMADCFIAETDVLFTYLQGWLMTKDNPELVRKSHEPR